ncbi:hypothetical protein J671_1709 [Acinetobacter sp. 1130196]|nr:hypothetical protein J514_3216 [Acinetobacter sp. 1396970]EXE47374.1 hypothetical protein J576_3484 [Acinetobacter sp. 766875]EXE76317.1 hypothetical protein J582_2567 [Acinetobacter sp. 1566109]EXF01424.1 hypothetical protein J594_0268 [Acinetobacter sp. 259052]EXH13663.1 hypothetical protein J627_2036 [Acinetobacter sp. 1245593]EXH74828.1 hypothetical protein J633_3140 [Acinetobacter sp. 216872]EXR18021.1 hypothetical protein J671_1709 [Acinetobacter sp. 1130196]EXR30902.1 hypothetical 
MNIIFYHLVFYDYFLNKETLYFIFRNISEKFQCIINL